MNEIMVKTYELIDVLDESDMMKDLLYYKERILENKELQKLIHQGNDSDDEYLKMDIKRRLYQNEDYKGYMDRYHELMYLVMEINSRYKKIIGKGSCSL